MQALLDGELRTEEDFTVRAHLDGCAKCESAVDGLRAAHTGFSAAVALTDRSISDRPLLGTPPPSIVVPRRPGRTVALQRAAALLLGVAASAAAAVPGSPLREWIAGEPRAENVVTAINAPETASTGVSVDSPEPEMGIGVAPVDGRFRVIVTGAASGLRIRVLVTSDPSGGAYTIGEATGTRFGGRGGVVEVSAAAGDELRVEFPLSATEASLEIDGRTYVVKDGGQLRHIGEGADRVGSEIIFELGP